MSEWLVAKHEWVESEGGTEESEGMRCQELECTVLYFLFCFRHGLGGFVLLVFVFLLFAFPQWIPHRRERYHSVACSRACGEREMNFYNSVHHPLFFLRDDSDSLAFDRPRISRIN